MKKPDFLTVAIWTIPLITALGMLLFLANYGVKSKSVQVIKPSHFDQAGEMGFWTYRQLRQRIFRHKLIVFGFDPRSSSHDDVLKAFIRTAKQDGQLYETIVTSKSLDMPGIQIIKVDEEIEPQSLDKILADVARDEKKAIIYLSSQRTSRLINGSMSQQIERQSGRKLLAISMLEQDESRLELLSQSDVCTDDLKYDSAEKLSCFYLNKRTKFAKEVGGRPANSLAGALELTGQDDYLLFIYKKI